MGDKEISPPQTPQPLSDEDVKNWCAVIYQNEQDGINPKVTLDALLNNGLDLSNDYWIYKAKQDAKRAFTGKPEKPPDISQGLDPPQVRDLLNYNVIYDRNGNPKDRKLIQSVRNWEVVLANDRRFKDKIWFDVFNQQITLKAKEPVPWEHECSYRPWVDADDSQLFSLIQNDYQLVKKSECLDAISNISHAHSFHPVRDLLNSLTWDGVSNMETLAIDFLGAENNEYNRAIMRLWLLEGVARIYEPGCKCDYTLLLKGDQGAGKSTFFQLCALDDDWYTDSLDDLSTKDAVQQIMGVWVCELSELKAISRTSGGAEAVKRFLSARTDRVRLAYDRRTITYKRGCIFGGSTNKENFLDDMTGNRRYLICEIGVNEPRKNLFDPKAIETFRQAWAQAVKVWKEEKPELKLPDKFLQTAKDMQEKYITDSGEVGLIRDYLEEQTKVCALQVWEEALNENGRPTRFETARINDIIGATPGWSRTTNPTKFGKYGSQRGFYKNRVCSQKSESLEGGFMQIDPEQGNEIPFD